MSVLTNRPLLIGLLLLIPFSACSENPPADTAASNQTRTGDKPVDQSIDDSEFMKIPLNSYDRTACSPAEKDPRWQGIEIVAPKQVEFDREKRTGPRNSFTIMPVCGFYNLLDTEDFTNSPFQVVVTDLESGKVYRGDLVDEADGHEIPPPDDDLPPDDAEEKPKYGTVVIGGYFNSNLPNYVRLPEASATYEVYVLRGESRSNKVKMSVVEATGKD